MHSQCTKAGDEHVPKQTSEKSRYPQSLAWIL